MRIGLKNRLRLISLLPIFTLFAITSYFAYNSFINYQTAQVLQDKLSENRQLNELVGNISRERGMTVMYLGNSSPNTLKSLNKQRAIVDEKAKSYITNTQANESLHDHGNIAEPCLTCANIKSISASLESIKGIRLLVDQQKASFEDVYKFVYGEAQNDAIKKLEEITKDQTDPDIKSLSSLYVSLVRAKGYTSSERDLISYALARSTKLQTDELSSWISLIAKSELINYDTLHNKELFEKLNTIYKDEDNLELIGDINLERTDIISASNTGDYESSPGIWFTMLSEKANIISDAQEILLSAMDDRARAIQQDVLQLLILSLTVWIVSIILGILGILLSNEIADNIKNLETVLNSVAQDTRDTHDHDIDIDLHSAEGTSEAYKLLETIIEQTREDKISAQEASEAKSMFLANMSHEIRTPLNGIVGFTELLKDTGLGEEQHEFVEIIEKSSENLLEIINNILDLSKIESNKLEIEDIIFSPIEEFESAVEVYAVRASEKHINLGCFIDPELEQPLKGDPTKIKEIVINLLSNAVKFTSNSGSINVNIRKLDSSDNGMTTVRFEVQDSGIGVTGEQKARIFEAFSQADTSITRKYGGTGLGLTISSRFVELMGGQLDLHSEPGQGTTFFFTISFEEVETLHDSTKGSFSTINALLLENEHQSKTQGTYLREYLDYYGVSYTSFKDPNELSHLQSQVDYDLLFIDYDYCGENDVINYSKQPQELVLLTKSTYMRKLDSLNANIFKVLYEPLNNTKIKLLLTNYLTQNFKDASNKKVSRKKFNADTSKFNANVLIAEDNIINQKLIKRTLEDIGLTVDIASNGLEAFQKRKDGNYDLMFMDIQMPFLDGVESTKEILEYEEDYSQAHIPIIALTANALKGDRERFLAAGLDEYTTKPLVRSEIVSLLNHFLADHIIDEDEVLPEVSEDAEEEIREENLNNFADKEVIVEETTELNELDTIEISDEIVVSEEEPFEIAVEETPEEEIYQEEVPQEIEETPEEIPEEIIVSTQAEYSKDILLAKKNAFEAKLFSQLLKSLGYSFDIARSQSEINEHLENSIYKVVLFEKEVKEIELSEFAQNIKEVNERNNLDTNLILINSSTNESPDDNLYVQEIISNVVKKDSLKLVFDKFI